MTTVEGLLGAPYRAIRPVRARDDGPWPGLLVRTATGEACVMVDADVLGPEWTGWDAAPEGHVLAPLDICRRPDGHDVALPVCVERLEEFVGRRGVRMPLSLGEAVTLGVSVLRGCAQIAGAPETVGDWWLDDAGRPVLATQSSPRPAREAAAAVLERVTVDASAQRTWRTALHAVTAERMAVRELEAAEEALFAIATPEPLSTVSLSPRSAAESGLRHHDPARAGVALPDHEPAPPSMWHSLVAGVDDDLADTVSRATTAVWRRLRRAERGGKPAPRRAPWLVGGAVAAAVLAGGALWPTASGVATEDPVDVVTPTPSGTDPARDGSPTDQVDAPTDAGSPADLAQVAGALLDARLACGNASDCLASVVVDAAPLPGGAIDLPAAERALTLLDDFGDIAVLRVDAADGAAPSQMVVILRRDDKWLLRDVSDVAQQPEQ
ncbi:hypothetical protein Q9R08_07195 [Microbacterium sp. QXD-8]|uniref:Uncharacterized protein n=1 Tax=Microbacterium psychrotolerans TaxID=3068321 RepID=A0ABU0YZI9_9MICO|nr:hypothetical protein [Microbacterium sp. QXD-8]MDQ7877753.1 hypothetical protein [Microbacterium sp. QXD-8]